MHYYMCKLSLTALNRDFEVLFNELWMSIRPVAVHVFSVTVWLRLYWIQQERERNVLFNDVLNTFYLQLYGIRLMVKDYSDSEKGNLLPPHRLLLSINSKGSFICTIPQTG